MLLFKMDEITNLVINYNNVGIYFFSEITVYISNTAVVICVTYMVVFRVYYLFSEFS